MCHKRRCLSETWPERKEASREGGRAIQGQGVIEDRRERSKEGRKEKDQFLTGGCVTADTVSANLLMLTWF